MGKKYKISLFIFHRDLRLFDNLGFERCAAESELVIPCFVFNPAQITAQNQYLSHNSLNFMLESLDDLKKQINEKGGELLLFLDSLESIVKKIYSTVKFDAVYYNLDVTPFSKKRDKLLSLKLKSLNPQIQVIQVRDCFLTSPAAFMKADSQPYRVFTPFFNNAKKIDIPRPQESCGKIKFFSGKKNEYTVTLEMVKRDYLNMSNSQAFSYQKGGRSAGLQRLNSLGAMSDYGELRDIPSLDATSKLSAHLKFGTISVREFYYSVYDKNFSKNSYSIDDGGAAFLRQLYWRDFYYYIALYFPHVLEGHAFRAEYDNLKWDYNHGYFEAWKSGQTGFPIVDAGMRQLLSTGYMHNRLRMVCAAFLVKDLHIDWKLGEKWFAQNLTDYDPALNNGGWQWSASTGCDAQPYFRIFNPFSQLKRFDPDCVFVKEWIPELRPYTAKQIQRLEKSPVEGYPHCIVDHSEASQYAKQMFR